MNDISNISDSIVEKIRKLLALNLSNNEHESSLALQKAKKLAAEYDIDLSLIEIFTKVKKNEPIIKNNGISLGNRKSITQRYVSWLLQNHFGVKVIYSGNRSGGMTMVLIGTKDKISIAEYVQGFLNQEFMNLWHNYYKNSGCRLDARNSYLQGLYDGLSEKLANEQKQVEHEKLSNQTPEVQNQFALMVVSEKDRLKDAVNSFYPNLGRAANYQSKSYVHNAILDGKIAGAKIQIRRSIGNNCVGAIA